MSRSRPNLLFMFGDQWRANALGYAGNEQVATPHIDRLASQSLNVRHCIAGTPVCCAWRASMLTGQYPDRHGVFFNDGALSPDAHTFGEHFAAAGYDTAYVGKWHVDGHGRTAFIPRERQHGFNHWRVLECTHNYNDSQYYADGDDRPRKWEGYDAFAQTNDVIHWLRGRDGSNPFCAFLSWGPPHSPYDTAPPQYRAMYEPQDIAPPPNVPPHMAEEARTMLTGYFAHCTALDDCVGRLMAELDALGVADNTIVVFTSDHGDMLGAHGLHEKLGPWEESLHVPMLLRWSAGLGAAGRESDVVYNMVDHFPTLSALAGLAPPPTAQGRDLSQHLRDDTTPTPNDALYANYFRFGTWMGQDERIDPLYRARAARGVRTTRYTYVEDRDGPWLLYDNEADPHQLVNLVNDARHSETKRHMHDRLCDMLAANDDRFEDGFEYVERFYPGAAQTLTRTRERRGDR